MPVTPPVTYPGVYVQEIPSGVRTITGVPTSIAAFIGRAPQGPVNEPTTVNNYGDYERTFGGLSLDSTMSYAVLDFFLNGGGQAIIVRLYKPADSDEIQKAKQAVEAAEAEIESAADDTAKKKAEEKLASVSQDLQDLLAKQGGAAGSIANVLQLNAASKGAWANSLQVKLSVVEASGMGQQLLDRYGRNEGELFDVSVYDGDPKKTAAVETMINVTLLDGPRRLDRVLEQESTLIRADVLADKVQSDALANPIKLEGGEESAALEAADFIGSENDKTGVYALEKADLFNILCIPPDSRNGDLADEVRSSALSYCVKRRAMLLVDPPAAWGANKETAANTAKKEFMSPGLGISGPDTRNAAIYFPRLVQADPLREGQTDEFPPCGAIAGIMARTDTTRGVWKAPAGLDASVTGIRGLQVKLTDAENGMLNPLGINCLRTFPTVGTVVWGARTLRGADQLGDEYKYVPVRRLALFIEETLFRSTQWAVFEPNDEPLWSQLRLNIGTFMHDLFRQGAFQGQKPSDAYFVRCDSTTTTQSDINKGIVNIMVGFAPLKPAEFVVIYLQQMAGDLAG